MCRIHHTSQKKHQFTKSEREKAGKCFYTQFDSHKCHSTNLKHHPKRVSQFLWRDKKILGNKRKKRTNMRIKQEIMKWKPSILAAHKVNCKNGTFLPKNPAQLPWVNKSLQLSTWEKTTRRVNLEKTHPPILAVEHAVNSVAHLTTKPILNSNKGLKSALWFHSINNCQHKSGVSYASSPLLQQNFLKGKW